MNITLPKFSMPTKARATKEIEKVEGTLLLQGVLLVTLLAVQLVLPDEDSESKS